MDSIVFGIGINNKKYPANGREYRLWAGMLRRCYGNNQDKYAPTYVNCTVSENFKHYSYFYEWCQRQTGFSNPEWQLDKDILVRHNQTYHEDLCVFVPRQINVLFVNSAKTRGLYPIGVSLHPDGRFRAQCGTLDNKRKHLGLFYTTEEAFLAYKNYKEALIKETAEQYKNIIDLKLYNAMLNYKIQITD